MTNALKPEIKHSSIHLPDPPALTINTLVTMMRTALVQTLRYASRHSLRTPPTTLRPLTICLSISSARLFPNIRVQGARSYSAPAGLAKPEVEGRIMDLLKNFDKVSLAFSRPVHQLIMLFSGQRCFKGTISVFEAMGLY